VSKEMPRRRKKRDVAAVGKWWSESQKIEAVTTYLALGNATQTAGVLDIPLATLNRWRFTDWWKKIEEDLKTEEHLQLNARLSKIVSKALDVTEDRLVNGNFQYDPKTSELIRVPVSIKDATKVATDMMARKEIIEAKPQQEQIERTVDDRLAKLAEQFRAFAKPKEKDITPQPLVIDNEA
jgi:hypothetical protein